MKFTFLTAVLALVFLASGQAGSTPAEVLDHLPYFGPSQQVQPYDLGGGRTVHEVLNGSSFAYGGDRF